MSQVTTKVPVDPLVKSKRGWFNIALAALGSLVAVPEIRDLVSENPKLAGAFTVISALTNYALLWKSKQGVVSKNVLVTK